MHIPKHLLQALLAALPCVPAQAQMPVEPEYGCKVKYMYDQAGNRTQRQWYCWSNDRSSQGAGGSADVQEPERWVSGLVDMELWLFPNPSSDRTTLQLSRTILAGRLDLMEPNGKLITSRQVTGHSFELDLRDLESGTYFARLWVDQEMLISTFTKH